MEYRMSRTLAVLMFCLAACSARAQERGLVRKGNELYSQGKWAEATADYEKATKKSPAFTPGYFNLGAALIQQKQYEAARRAMDNAAKTAKDPQVQANAHYNTGNTYMSEQQWQKALDAYKAALRRDPQDADARYNYSYALEKLRQQQQQDKKNQQQQNKQDKKQDDGKQDKDQKKNQGNQDDKNDQQGQHQQRPQAQPSKLTEQQADNLLKALQQDERKVQDKMQQEKATPVKLEKDW